MKAREVSRSVKRLSTLDDFLDEEGKLEEFETAAIKEVLAWQLAEAMQAQNLSRKQLAESDQPEPNQTPP
jgi:hypothetical protein